METNVTKFPAGIMGDIEAFCFDNKKYLIIDGIKTRFQNAPGHVQRIFVNGFMADDSFRNWLKSTGITGFIPGFEKWFFCKFGAYDSQPDVVNGKLIPDRYNSACSDYNCEMRGKFCGNLPFRIRSYEVQTLQYLMSGYSAEQTAAKCFVSIPGIKSRIEKLKEETGARNTAHLVSIATTWGIQPIL